MADGNPDIVLELLLSGVLTEQISPETVQLALGWTADRMEEHDHVPGPESAAKLPEAIIQQGGITSEMTDGSDRDRGSVFEDTGIPAEWGMDYHTNLVAGLTCRILLDRWESIDNETDGEWTPGSLVDLGVTLDAFAGYDLNRGANRLSDLAGTCLPDRLIPLRDAALAFLEDQQRSDDTFGFWTDERRAFERLGHDDEAFETGPLARTSSSCARALEAHGREQRRENDSDRRVGEQ